VTGRSLDTSAVTRPGAFLGGITTSVRDRAVARFDGADPGRTLDVGCGNGLFFAALGQSAQAYHGLDADRLLLREARRVFADNGIARTSLVEGDLADLPYLTGSFDYVFFLNTLVNIPSEEATAGLLDELARVCRPGGRIFLDIRNGRNPWLRARYWWHNHREDFITRGHDLGRIRNAFLARGFGPVEVHTIGLRIPVMAWAYVLEATKSRPSNTD